MCFALAQTISDDGDKGVIGRVEGEMLRVLDFDEFVEAISRLAYVTMSKTKEDAPVRRLDPNRGLGRIGRARQLG